MLALSWPGLSPPCKNLAGLVLLRQKPGSAKGVMFITLEDETDVANLVVWTTVFEKYRQIVLGASMMGLRGQVQRDGEVIHVIVQRLDDLSDMLAGVGRRKDVASIYQVSRADVVRSPVTPDPRDPAERALGKILAKFTFRTSDRGRASFPDAPPKG